MDGKRSWLLALLLAVLALPGAIIGWIKRRASGNTVGENLSRADTDKEGNDPQT